MSAVNLDIPDQTDGTNTGSRRNTVDATSIAPDSEHEESFGNNHFTESQRYLPEQLNSSEDLSLFPSTQLAEKVVNEVPHSTKTGIASSHFSQGKAPLPHAYTNGCGAPQASVRQQPHVSGKRRIGSTTSVCTNRSKKSCKSTASQIQEVAGDDRCAHCALACLFCEFMSLCSLALDCGGCGGCLEVCCRGDGGESLAESCCGEAGPGNCPCCGLGCGMLQDCCSSSDCLEICLECCSLCFPA
ncbi:myoD family inhibitor domain-containing protein-like [Hemicordylus capensis]|uniref:myoD family inhibitor domain-containing protein-like n=1 Tax=Hemicordylus capensis TaxID=884348 RepID=UPI00230287F6|nr:myoD family inhibitor domain-containing protein-like [Hemicordylus capensis]XP_053145566.1 myoD family inhibitor domain-containing protein-like [Hemicordylus capensis]